MSDEDTPEVVQCADDACEAIRLLNHHSSWSSLPAPLVHQILGNLKCVGHTLPQALNRIKVGLGKSLNDYEVYESDGGDPVQTIVTANDHLARAVQLAAQLGQELEEAQSAIERQGYKKVQT